MIPQVLDVWHEASEAERNAYIKEIDATIGYKRIQAMMQEGRLEIGMFKLLMYLGFAQKRGHEQVIVNGDVLKIAKPILSPDFVETWGDPDFDFDIREARREAEQGAL